MSAPGAQLLRGGSGYFRVLVIHPSGRSIDVTVFRDVPTQVGEFSSADPFGDASASVSFPGITSYDSPGSGDLWWLVPWARVELRWYDLVSGVPVLNTGWRWEGNLVSEEISDPYSISCKGALYALDNFKAAPFHPQYPVPFEVMLTRAFDPKTHPTTAVKSLKIEWPADWNVYVPGFSEPDYLWFLAPWGVKPGQRWSGLTTRSTGSWDDVLTGHVNSILQSMYTPEGDQWTIVKGIGRQPILRVRNPLRYDVEDTLVVHNGVPGVSVSCSRDYSQSANVIYGEGTDLAGTQFSGEQVTSDGQSTYFEPFAALPQVYPASATNPRYLSTYTRKEGRLTFQQGLDERAAREVAVTSIRRFADPGYSGSITLQSDPLQAGLVFNRLLIQAGQDILVKGYRGTNVLFHISAVTVNVNDSSVSLTVDTKFRDALTVDEVRARTRDALDPINLLKAGALSVTTQDLLLPWSYSKGSGIVPSGGALDATPFFKAMPLNTPFPWTSWTTRYPPKDYPKYYIKVSEKGPKANDRWQDAGYDAQGAKRSIAVPIRGAQTAQIRLTQIAAYDSFGHVLPVRFHFGIYSNSGVTSLEMPMIPVGSTGLPYAAGQRYPFFPEAFNQVKPNGEQQDNPDVMLPQGADLVVAWGTYEEPAGYSPGLKSAGAPKSGLLVDEAGWSFDTSAYNGFDPYSAANNATNKSAGQLFCMVFCDDVVDDVYFLGRFFREEPGGS